MAQQVINRVWSAFSACVCYLQAQSEFLGIEIRVGTRYADVTKTNAATFKLGFLFSGSDATDTAMKSSYAGGLFVSAETECPRGWHAERPLADAPLRCVCDAVPRLRIRLWCRLSKCCGALSRCPYREVPGIYDCSEVSRKSDLGAPHCGHLKSSP
jgi:hypothetical protein